MTSLGPIPDFAAPESVTKSVTAASQKMAIKGYVINLRRREDRWKEIQERFRLVKSIQLERFEALEGKPGWVYCGMSHKALVAAAKARGDPYVLVLEDDATAEDAAGFDLRFTRILRWLEKNPEKWDVFSGGQNLPSDRPSFHPRAVIDKRLRILELADSWCAHFVIYSSRAYDKMLEWDSKAPAEIQERDAIDVYIMRNLRQITTVPYLSLQAPGSSDLMGSQWDYTTLMRKSESRAINFLKDRL